MSSILKALKKLENEKITRKPDSFMIDSEILRAKSPRKFIFPSGASLAAIALFFCGIGVTYLSMKRHDIPVSFPAAQSATTEIKKTSPRAVELPSKTEKSKPELDPHQKKQINSSRKRAETSLAYIRIPTTLRQRLPEKATMSAPRIIQPEPKSPSPLSAPIATAASPLIKVDGIAFQEGSANNAAVVNGVVVSKSSMVEGARVEEIKMDRVTFSRGSEKFEVILDK